MSNIISHLVAINNFKIFWRLIRICVQFLKFWSFNSCRDWCRIISCMCGICELQIAWIVCVTIYMSVLHVLSEIFFHFVFNRRSFFVFFARFLSSFLSVFRRLFCASARLRARPGPSRARHRWPRPPRSPGPSPSALEPRDPTAARPSKIWKISSQLGQTSDLTWHCHIMISHYILFQRKHNFTLYVIMINYVIK